MSAQKEEIIRKLEYVKKMINEAENLIVDIPELQSDQVMDFVQNQTELLTVLIQGLASGKIKVDEEVDSRFMQATKKLLDIKKAELAVEMDSVESEYLDKIKKKKYTS